MSSKRYRVWMHSRPAMCREFHDGKVDVAADDEETAIKRAKDRAASVHGHRDWVIERVEILDR